MSVKLSNSCFESCKMEIYFPKYRNCISKNIHRRKKKDFNTLTHETHKPNHSNELDWMLWCRYHLPLMLPFPSLSLSISFHTWRERDRESCIYSHFISCTHTHLQSNGCLFVMWWWIRVCVCVCSGGKRFSNPKV